MKNGMIHVISILIIITALPALLAGCGSDNNKDVPDAALSFEFTFAEGPEGWIGEFVDLPMDYDPDLYGLIFAHNELPAEVGPGNAVMLSGQNSSDDLFMFIKKQLGPDHGLKPETTYEITIEMEIASNAPAGAIGIGGPPGEALFVKVGAATHEPVPVEDPDGLGWWRLSADKGAQSEGGENAVVVGNIAKPTCTDFVTYELKTLDNRGRPLSIKSDKNGNLWIFVGTDSGFEGKTTLYYTRIHVTLQ